MSDRGKLINNKDWYEALGNKIKDIYFDIHAIYTPDGHGSYGDCYMAGVDLFKPGLTFRVYFTYDDGENMIVEYAERWRFG